jgi:hypothetical protein
MSRLLLRTVLILLGVGLLTGLTASGNAIGMAVTNGSFQVDHSRVWGNATIFEGSVIETATASSRLQLNGGIQMRLASGSLAAVYQRKLVLERGIGQMESPADYEVEARSLHISAAVPETVARVRVDGPQNVTVAALRGAVRVTNATGVLVAEVEAGKSLEFEPQEAGALAPTRASGCLLEKSGKAMVVDRTTNVILQLSGTGFEPEIGNHVEITGMAEHEAAEIPGASQVVRVALLKHVSTGGCGRLAKKLGVAAGAGAAGAAGAAAAGSTGAAAGAGAATAGGIGAGTIAVIGGVATAATVGGLAAAGSLPGQGETPAPVSR